MKRDKGRLPAFVPLLKETLASPAWKAMSHGARSLFPTLPAIKIRKNLSRPKVEWAPHLDSCALTRGNLRVCGGSSSQALIDKSQIIEGYNHRTKQCCVLSQDDGTSSSDRRAIECPKVLFSHRIERQSACSGVMFFARATPGGMSKRLPPARNMPGVGVASAARSVWQLPQAPTVLTR
jgi:hypothetical protein